MSKSATCIQNVPDKYGRMVKRRRPHDVPTGGTGDPNNGYTRCRSCGVEVYVGSGLHPNLGVPMEQAEEIAAFLRRNR